MSGPLVSILIPCHNAERWVGEAIESALLQTYAPKEVIVIDDGSTDGSRDVIESFGDHVVASCQENMGSNPTRNRLLALSRGFWVQYLDADDYLEPTKIEVQLSASQTDWQDDVLWQSITLRHEGRNGPSFTQFGYHEEPIDMWVKFILWHTPQTGAFLYRADALRAIGGWREDQPCCQDNAMTLALLMAGRRFRYTPCHGAVYREHSTLTLSRKDPGKVMKERVRLLLEAELHLQRTGQLTDVRRKALSQARIETARTLWPIDRSAAKREFSYVRRQTPGFYGDAPVPVHYRRIASLIGFNGAERLAEIMRFARRSDLDRE